MSNWKIEEYGALCELEHFEINGMRADYDDFGEKYDHDSENAEDYGCGDMRFDSKAATEEVLNKYGITTEEYDKICDELEEKLSFGCCGWCV
jgi:hypothetical protein